MLKYTYTSIIHSDESSSVGCPLPYLMTAKSLPRHLYLLPVRHEIIKKKSIVYHLHGDINLY